MTVEAINSFDEFKSIINSDSGEIIIIDFWATWCGPCKVISPIFETLSQNEYDKKVKFYKVDVDEQEAISQEVGIRAMPTFMVFKDGKKVDDVVGANPPRLEELVRTAVKGSDL